MKYLIYFELFGKKMKYIIEANNEQDAEYKLRGKIKIHNVREIGQNDKENIDLPDFMKDVFNGFNK